MEGLTVIELGAGTALPSLVASVLPKPPSLVVVTDYPDEVILGNLNKNVERNKAAVSPGCIVRCEGYEWGEDVDPILRFLPPSPVDSPFHRGYDIVILSDLLHFDRSHDVLLASLTTLLTRRPSARAYVAAGIYTSPEVCNRFLREAERLGIAWTEGGSGVLGAEEDPVWRGSMEVKGLESSQLGVRKCMCRWWVGQWSDYA